jgi:hypothetical protein
VLRLRPDLGGKLIDKTATNGANAGYDENREAGIIFPAGRSRTDGNQDLTRKAFANQQPDAVQFGRGAKSEVSSQRGKIGFVVVLMAFDAQVIDVPEPVAILPEEHTFITFDIDFDQPDTRPLKTFQQR